MTKQEQLLLLSVIDNLRANYQKTWETGDFEAWTKWARKMAGSIESTVGILQTLTHSTFLDSTKTVENLTLKEMQKLPTITKYQQPSPKEMDSISNNDGAPWN